MMVMVKLDNSELCVIVFWYHVLLYYHYAFVDFFPEEDFFVS